MVDGWTIDSWAEGKSSRFTGRSTASWPMRVSIRGHCPDGNDRRVKQFTTDGREEVMTKASVENAMAWCPDKDFDALTLEYPTRTSNAASISCKI